MSLKRLGFGVFRKQCFSCFLPMYEQNWKGPVDTGSVIYCLKQWVVLCPRKSSVPGMIVTIHHDHDKKHLKWGDFLKGSKEKLIPFGLSTYIPIALKPQGLETYPVTEISTRTLAFKKKVELLHFCFFPSGFPHLSYFILARIVCVTTEWR